MKFRMFIIGRWCCIGFRKELFLNHAQALHIDLVSWNFKRITTEKKLVPLARITRLGTLKQNGSFNNQLHWRNGIKVDIETKWRDSLVIIFKIPFWKLVYKSEPPPYKEISLRLHTKLSGSCIKWSGKHLCIIFIFCCPRILV